MGCTLEGLLLYLDGLQAKGTSPVLGLAGSQRDFSCTWMGCMLEGLLLYLDGLPPGPPGEEEVEYPGLSHHVHGAAGQQVSAPLVPFLVIQ